MKKPLAEVREDLQDVSLQVSTQVRALTLGVLAVAWLGLSGADEVQALNLSGDWQLAAIALLCIVTLAIDLAQYQFGYELVCRTLIAAEKARHKEAAYSRKSIWFKARGWAFRIKQGLAVVAAVWLVMVLTLHILSVSGAASAGSNKKPESAASTLSNPPTEGGSAPHGSTTRKR